MKQNLKLIIPVLLLFLLLLSACELPRPGGDAGDIAVDTPDIAATPAEAVTPPTEPTTAATDAAAPTGVAPPPADIDPEAVPAQTAPPADAVEPGKVIVKLSPQAAIQSLSAQQTGTTGNPGLDQTLQQFGITGLEPLVQSVAQAANADVTALAQQTEGVSQLYSVSFPADQDPVAVANALAQDPNVEYAEPNYLAGIVGSPAHVPALLDPNDQYFGFQWHMPKIQMPAAWDSSTGENVIVAVIDTGVDFNAPDLANTRRLPGFDFVNNDTDPTDDQGHGTHVTGTVAQSTNNNIGVTGVAFNAQILPVKVLGSSGDGSYENIIKGITYAVDQGADVINMSLAGRQGSQALLEAVKLAHNRGVVVVAAAGNSNGPVEYPAAYDDFVIAVGATRFDNTRTDYSNFGPQIDIVAPGGDIGVDQNGDTYADGVLQQTFKSPGSFTYLFFEGTSMASPHVAGVAALLLSKKPDASPAEIEAIMAQTAIQGLGPVEEYGAGLVQAASALGAVLPPTPPTDTPTPVPPEPATDTPTPIPPEPATDTPTPIPPEPATNTPTPQPPDQPTHTPTPVPPEPPTDTPTPQPPPSGDLLFNGDFEADEAWLFPDTPVRGSYSADVAFSGSRSAKVGILPGETDRFSYTSVSQQVTIPAEANSVMLTAHIYPISEDIPGTDWQNILILNSNFRTIRKLSQELSNSQTWEERSYDLSDLSGQTIYVYFGVVNRGGSGKPTAMYVDKVSLTWAP